MRVDCGTRYITLSKRKSTRPPLSTVLTPYFRDYTVLYHNVAHLGAYPCKIDERSYICKEIYKLIIQQDMGICLEGRVGLMKDLLLQSDGYLQGHSGVYQGMRFYRYVIGEDR
jgi:hypothetical protein